MYDSSIRCRSLVALQGLLKVRLLLRLHKIYGEVDDTLHTSPSTVPSWTNRLFVSPRMNVGGVGLRVMVGAGRLLLCPGVRHLRVRVRVCLEPSSLRPHPGSTGLRSGVLSKRHHSPDDNSGVPLYFDPCPLPPTLRLFLDTETPSVTTVSLRSLPRIRDRTRRPFSSLNLISLVPSEE